MIHRPRKTPPPYVYPSDPWRMVEKRFYPRLLGQTETYFTVANGYLGLRGTHDEGRPVAEQGTLVNAFHETWPIVYGEEAFGYARTGQTIVEVTDGKLIKLYVDDEPFYLPTATIGDYERVLDMRTGTLDRSVIWHTPGGKRVLIRSRRLVSLEHRHVAAIDYEVTLLDAEAPVVIASEIVCRHAERANAGDPRRSAGFEERVLMPGRDFLEGRRIILGHTTRSSDMRISCGADHVFESECDYTEESGHDPDFGEVVFSVDARPGVPIRLTKFLAYHTSRSRPLLELEKRTRRTLDRTVEHGFGALLESQRHCLDAFWERADIEVDHDEAIQQAVRFSLFQIHQASARAEGTGVPAKGLTGHGYEGHYFWDTEIYVLPFLTYTSPAIAEKLLRFRCGFLDKARERARELNQKGALFSWRTIGGEEASAYYAAGTAQYHIDADVAYAIRKYVQVAGDEEFLERVGAEVLVETARLWEDLGFYSGSNGGRFCIHGVTGPDEYNTVVNNNAFTNLMARENLWFAAEVIEQLQETKPDAYAQLAHRCELRDGELEAWRRAADHMYIPFDADLGINPQDDLFLTREPWDLDATPPEKFPLLLHYHPLVIYRHQVIKQADIVLAMFLLGDEFTREQRRRNFEYYDPLTTGDSSLSVCIQAIMAFELGLRQKAEDYSHYALLMDLEDIHGNVTDGLHIASMGGTWMMIVYGYAGMRDDGGRVRFRPRQMPREDARIRIPLTIRGRRLDLEMRQEEVTYTLREGEELTIGHEDEEIRLTREAPSAKRPSLPWPGEH